MKPPAPPFKLIEPYPGLMRELSPTVPPEIRERLTLGSPPESLHSKAHPVARFLRKRCEQLGWDRMDLARRVSAKVTHPKTLRRIDELLEGKRLLPAWIEKLSDVLEISPEELAVAWAETREWEEERFRFQRLRTRHTVYNRLGPYLRALVPRHFENLESQPLAPPSNRIASLFEVHGNPQPDQLHLWLREHSEHLVDGVTPVAGWLYVPTPEIIHFFSRTGTLIATGPADDPPPEGMEEYLPPLSEE